MLLKSSSISKRPLSHELHLYASHQSFDRQKNAKKCHLVHSIYIELIRAISSKFACLYCEYRNTLQSPNTGSTLNPTLSNIRLSKRRNKGYFLARALSCHEEHEAKHVLLRKRIESAITSFLVAAWARCKCSKSNQ